MGCKDSIILILIERKFCLFLTRNTFFINLIVREGPHKVGPTLLSLVGCRNASNCEFVPAQNGRWHFGCDMVLNRRRKREIKYYMDGVHADLTSVNDGIQVVMLII